MAYGRQRKLLGACLANLLSSGNPVLTTKFPKVFAIFSSVSIENNDEWVFILLALDFSNVVYPQKPGLHF